MNNLYLKYAFTKSKMLNFHLSEKKRLKSLFNLSGADKSLLLKRLSKHNTSLLLVHEVNNIIACIY